MTPPDGSVLARGAAQERRLSDWLEEAAEDPRGGGWVLRGRIRPRRLGFAHARASARRLARELEARGIAKGEHVVLWGSSSPEWVAAFLGAMLRGVVVVPLDDVAGADFARRVAAATRPRLALVDRGSLDAAREAFGEDVPVEVLDDVLSLVSGRDDGPLEPVAIAPSDPLQVVFTSGTTSEPKGVVLSHRNVLANLVPIERLYRRWNRRLGWAIRRRSVISLLPLSHVFGQSVGIFVPLMMRLRCVFVAVPGPSTIREACRREGALVAMAVPRFLTALRRELEAELDRRGDLEAHLARRQRLEGRSWARRLLASWRVRRRFGWRFSGFVVGGSALDPAEERAWKAMGVVVVQGYGLTETAPIVTIDSPFSSARGRVGRPLGEQQVRLSEEGEVLVRGGNVAEGYLRDGVLEPLVDENGWFHTGDLGEIDEQGSLRIVGRAKDVIVGPEGLNVHPRDVEEVLDAQPGVREAAVVGLPRPEGEQVHAVLLLEHSAEGETSESLEAKAEGAVRAANDRLPSYQRVRGWTVWPEADLPRTSSTRKVKKREIVERLGSEEGVAAARGGGVEALLEEMIGGERGRDSRLADLDLSSLDVVELVTRLEGRFGVVLDEGAISAETTIAELDERVRDPERHARRALPIPRWAANRPARVLGLIVRACLGRPMIDLFAPRMVQGRERIRAMDGPVLVIANHASYFDAPTVFAALPLERAFRLATLMATEPFDPLFSEGGARWERAYQRLRYTLAVLAFNAVPLPRSAGFRRSLERAGELVERGHSVLVFPEGRMARDGRDQPFRDGIGLLASELAVPVVPVRIAGLHDVLPPGASWPRRGRVRVTIGEAVEVTAGEAPERLTRRLERALRDVDATRLP